MFSSEKDAKKLVSILKTHLIEAFYFPANIYDNIGDYLEQISNIDYSGKDARDL